MASTSATILVAEDDDLVRRFLQDLLTFEKHRVEVCESLGRALWRMAARVLKHQMGERCCDQGNLYSKYYILKERDIS